MDEINARNRLRGSVFSLFMRGSKIKEIDTEFLAVVDSQVKALVDEGKTFIHPGVLFIDDSYLLDLEAFSARRRKYEEKLMCHYSRRT